MDDPPPTSDISNGADRDLPFLDSDREAFRYELRRMVEQLDSEVRTEASEHPLDLTTRRAADAAKDIVPIVVGDNGLDHGERHDADLAFAQVGPCLGIAPAAARGLDTPPRLR